jgi:hypothetical protein
MRIKVELHPDVQAWLWQHRHDRRLVDSFYRQLRWVCEDPLNRSEPTYDPSLSRYMLRFLGFGEKDDYIAIFQFDPARDLMRVLECRRLKPARRSEGGPSDRGEPP